MSSAAAPIDAVARHRSRLTTALPSLIAPGVGHLNVGRARRGLVFFAVFGGSVHERPECALVPGSLSFLAKLSRAASAYGPSRRHGSTPARRVPAQVACELNKSPAN
jgi:hypothetical protein